MSVFHSSIEANGQQTASTMARLPAEGAKACHAPIGADGPLEAFHWETERLGAEGTTRALSPNHY
jgi:hypothetical protein